ncbi:MAG: purine-binding chemotaxis protein [Candidatus Methanolliviera sp. GoM_asphalt]|nr:MAG: purine-binding chemotaxis protein [Candidatus Methanolliviera sp. GoM_asphalt]
MEDEQFVIFDLGCEQYGVEISQVREIIRPKDMTRIPNAPDYVEGVINLRGQVTTIINLGRRLGFPDKEKDKIKVTKKSSNMLNITRTSF